MRLLHPQKSRVSEENPHKLVTQALRLTSENLLCLGTYILHTLHATNRLHITEQPVKNIIYLLVNWHFLRQCTTRPVCGILEGIVIMLCENQFLTQCDLLPRRQNGKILQCSFVDQQENRRLCLRFCGSS